MDFKLVLPYGYNNKKGKTIWKLVWPKLTILSSKNHKNGHISKCHFGQLSITKIPTPLYFSMNLSETLIIDVNIDFANNSGFLIYKASKNLSPNKREYLTYYCDFSTPKLWQTGRTTTYHRKAS